MFLAKLDEALEVVRREPASVRRARVQPLLDQFSITNMVRLATGEKAMSDAATSKREAVREAAAARSGAR